MTFIEAISSGFKKYIEFKGRASLSEYWWFALFVFLVSLIGDLIDSSGVVTLLLMTAFLIPYTAVGVRRLHDTNRSGWWLLIPLTVIGIIPMTIWLASKGSNESNQYGEPILNNEVLNSINNFKIDSEKNEKSHEIANIDALSWNQAINEFEGETRNRGLYAKLFAETQGDESKVKARYIEIRAKEIQASKTPDVPSSLSTSD